MDIRIDTQIVEVIALSGFETPLAYGVPPTCKDQIKVGSLIRIPLRRRSELGVVKRFGTDQIVPPGKMKMLYEVVQDYEVLPPDLMKLYDWVRSYYAATPEAFWKR